MPLPNADVWIMDYPTARSVFDGGDDGVKDAIQGLCDDGQLKICHCEAADFRRHEKLKEVFCNGGDCILDLEPEIIDIARALPENLGGKTLLRTDRLTRMIVETAIHLHGGLVSIRSGPFLTILDLGSARGVPSLTLGQFLGHL